MSKIIAIKRKNIMKNTVLSVICLLCTLTVQSQSLYFKHLGIADGLSQVRTQAIYQDETGAIWISTAEGLNRYNGSSVSTCAPVSARSTVPAAKSAPLMEKKNCSCPARAASSSPAAASSAASNAAPRFWAAETLRFAFVKVIPSPFLPS